MRFRRQQSGQSLTEFALVFTFILVPIIFGTIDFARIVAAYSQTANSTRRAARYAASFGYVGALENFRNCEDIAAIASDSWFTDAGTYDVDISYEAADGTALDPTYCEDGSLDDQSAPDPIENTSAPPATALENGDRVVINVRATVTPLTPLWAAYPFPINFEAKRTIVKDIILETATFTPLPPPPPPPAGACTADGNDNDLDGMIDDWEVYWETQYPTALADLCDAAVTEDHDGDGCDLLCEYNYNGNPYGDANGSEFSFNNPPAVTLDWLNPDMDCSSNPNVNITNRSIALNWTASTVASSVDDTLIANYTQPSTSPEYRLDAQAYDEEAGVYGTLQESMATFASGTTSCTGDFEGSGTCGITTTIRDEAMVLASDPDEVQYTVDAFIGDGTISAAGTSRQFVCDTDDLSASAATNFVFWNAEADCTNNNANKRYPAFQWGAVTDVIDTDGWYLQLLYKTQILSSYEPIFTDLTNEQCGGSFDKTNGQPPFGCFGYATQQVKDSWIPQDPEQYRIAPVVNGTIVDDFANPAAVTTIENITTEAFRCQP